MRAENDSPPPAAPSTSPLLVLARAADSPMPRKEKGDEPHDPPELLSRGCSKLVRPSGPPVFRVRRNYLLAPHLPAMPLKKGPARWNRRGINFPAWPGRPATAQRLGGDTLPEGTDDASACIGGLAQLLIPLSHFTAVRAQSRPPQCGRRRPTFLAFAAFGHGVPRISTGPLLREPYANPSRGPSLCVPIARGSVAPREGAASDPPPTGNSFRRHRRRRRRRRARASTPRQRHRPTPSPSPDAVAVDGDDRLAPNRMPTGSRLNGRVHASCTRDLARGLFWGDWGGAGWLHRLRWHATCSAVACEAPVADAAAGGGGGDGGRRGTGRGAIF